MAEKSGNRNFYLQFHIIICGLDSVEARRWINATLVSMIDDENPESLKPLIDGGTEGLEFVTQSTLKTDDIQASRDKLA